MARSPSPEPCEVLKSFIDFDELEIPRKLPPMESKYVPRSVEAVATMHHAPIRPTTLSSASSSRGSMVSNTEDKELSPSSSTNTVFKRKKAIYRKSQTQMALTDEKPIPRLSRAYSLDSPLHVPHAYNPNEPLTNFPPKKSFSSQDKLVRVRSIKTTIGPLTKEVCEKLNMSLQLDQWQTKCDHTQLLNLRIPDYTGEEVFSVEVKEDSMLITIKEQLVSELNKKHPNRLWSFIHNCQFVYTLGGRDYQLLDDFHYICNSFLYQHFLHAKSFPMIIVRKKYVLTEEEVILEDRIHTITKMSMYGYMSSRDSGVFDTVHSLTDESDDEINWAKLTLKSFAVEVARYRDSVKYSMMTELDLSPVTQHLAAKVPSNCVINVFIHVQKFVTLERLFSVNLTAAAVLAEVLPCLQSVNATQSHMDSYVLQVAGEETYIVGDVRLFDFKAVRRTIVKGEDLHLSVVSKPLPHDDQLYSVDWPLVDPLTGTAPTHDYLVDCVDRINGISLWSLTSPLKVCINKISNIPHQLYRKDICNVEIEMGIYVGGMLLREAEKISATISCKEIVLDKTIIFDINKSSIPKATRLMVVVKEDTKGKRQGTAANSSTSLELFWATVSLIDYRNLLKVGVLEVYMWPTAKATEKDTDPEKYSSDPNPIGPIASNPDPSAVQLTIEFECFAHPVIFPNDVPAHVAKERNSSSRSYERGISCIFDVMNADTIFVMNLPAYIEKVDWSVPQQVTEAYNFIHSLKESLPLAVAFKFLDSDCPDEFVRAFAVERLRELKDDELMGYLLQLVQALKFEANHDSALARFLLERALQNKLIGHFFFWYSRCEAQNPQFTARYDTLLEAYLVGCGKVMLDNLINQVSTLGHFEKITRELEKAKCHTASDSQKVLKKLLTKYEFSSKTVIPPYNPRMRYGNLVPERCKVMQSKKMPMWLSMSNIHPSAIQPVPYKLIVKSGDDLRQDMLTLQMLTLFDKIWQEDGLDLCLIPYGCVATGPNSGIIEVVKDAKTVADISGITDNTMLLQWIEDHQTDQFGEKDPDLLKAAINKFIRSCAGYSVATYVLGIGDRHNDNIMVTTSGNLFHIDFGHFLGNVKHFMKVKREWCPFVLTPDFIHVMGGEKSDDFNEFKKFCCKAFLSLRKHADLIINLFSMMRYTGIPELTCVEDLQYLRDALMVTKDGATAEKSFEKLINKCIRLGWTVQISWWAHVKRTRTI